MTSTAAVFDLSELSSSTHAVACEARDGLTRQPKALSPWLFYDKAGSDLFEQITELPEYYLTRTEGALFKEHAAEILHEMGVADQPPASRSSKQPISLRYPLTVAELGAGSATKTGVLLRQLVSVQGRVSYQPIDISASALAQAKQLERQIPGVSVRPCVANYVAEPYHLERTRRTRVLALYIGSSIGNFTPDEARSILHRLRERLRPGDGLLLGTDTAPGRHKTVDRLCEAYDDAEGVTAAFNRNVLVRLNREIGSDFCTENFEHSAAWNQAESRMEMHLRSLIAQTVTIPASSAGPAVVLRLNAGETIHTENSYKFTDSQVHELLSAAGFTVVRSFKDQENLFSLTLAKLP